MDRMIRMIYLFHDTNWPCSDSLGDSYSLTYVRCQIVRPSRYNVVFLSSVFILYTEYKECSLHWNLIIIDIISSSFLPPLYFAQIL